MTTKTHPSEETFSMAEVTFSPSDYRKLSQSVGRNEEQLKTLTRKMERIVKEIQEEQSDIKEVKSTSRGWNEQNSHGSLGLMLAEVRSKLLFVFRQHHLT